MELDGVDGGAGLTDNAAPVAQDTTPVGTQQAPTGENPAWGELLGTLPSEFHNIVRPHLQKWEQGVNDRFTKVQSEYAPYKDFLGVDPQQIQASLQLAQLVATDPRAFYDRMAEHYGAEWGLTGQGQGAENADDYSLDGIDDEEIDPRLQQLQQQQDTIAQYLATQLEREQQQQYEAEVQKQHQAIDTEFKQVSDKFGFAEGLPPQAQKMIISLCAANEGLTITQAAEEVMPLFSQQTRPNTPRIVSPGGGVPANNLDTAKMGRQDTVSLVTQMLAQAKQAQQ